MRFAVIATAAGLAAGSLAAAASAEPLKVVSEGPVTIQSLKSIVVHSDRVGRNFQVIIHQPSATAFLPSQKFPVIYALDGGYGLAGQDALLLGNTGAMQPAIVVEVGYLPGEGAHRNDDLTHIKVTQGPMSFGGGGAAFEAFLADELRPFIESRVPADAKRSVLFGHSLGGLFAARVFADNPNAYAGYIIGSASVWADPAVVAAVAQAAPRAKDVRIYLTVGEMEDGLSPGVPPKMLNGFKALAGALKGRAGVTLRTQLYAGETHLSYYPRLVTDGFPFVAPPIRPLDFHDQPLQTEAVKRYVGVYAMPDGRTLTVRMPEGPPGGPQMLQAQVTGIVPVPLMQNGKDRFYNPTSDIDATFDGSGLTMVADNAKMRVEKVKPAP